MQEPINVPHLLDLLLPQNFLLSGAPGPGAATMRFSNITMRQDACVQDVVFRASTYMAYSPEVSRVLSVLHVQSREWL